MANNTLTFTLEGRDRLSRVLDSAGDSAGRLEARLALASAAIPAAAALAPLIAQTGAAAVAVAAFGAAVVPQIGALTDASKAQKKYEDAVSKSGARSEAAVTAQVAYQKQMAKLPPATREASVALSGLSTAYKGWSDGLAKDTMPVFTHGLAVAGALLPKLTPLVKGASVELNRLMTIAAAGVQSPGLDRLMGKFSAFATGSLKNANDSLVHLLRTLDTGAIGGGFTRFMDYARQQGPLVGETLRNLAKAALNVLQAASETGVGVLQLANAFAKVVASLPPGFIAFLLQAALAIRAVRLAISGVQLAAGAFVLVRTQIRAAATAAIGASTAMGTLRAAFMALSLSARTAVAATGIGLLVLGLIKLSSIGKSAPPDVDRLTTSLGKLAQTGKVAGEAARAFGADLGGLADSLRTLSRPGNLDKTQQFLTSLIGMDSTPVKEAKQDLDAVDKALSGLVQGGKSELAAAAFDKLAAGMKKNGMSAGELRDKLDDYQSALADQAFEQELAAQSMGLFGAQAQQVQAKLDAQKQSADGLRQSIAALNDANRAGIGGMIGFEASIDAAAKAAKDNAGALHMSGGELNLNSEKARNAATALNDLAAKTDEAATQARQSGQSWETVNGIYTRGRDKLEAYARQMGLNKDQARALADQILKTPDKTARLKGNLEDLQAKLSTAKSQLAHVPDSRKAAIRADIQELEAKVRRAKDALAGIRGRSIPVSVYLAATPSDRDANGVPDSIQARANGGLVGYPTGGMVRGPGTGTSDSILARVSNGEFVVRAASVARYGVAFLNALNAGRLGMASSLGSAAGMSGAGQQVGRGLSAGMEASASGVEASARAMAAAVTTGVRDELEIASPSKKMRALAADAGRGIIVGLTGSRAKISATAKDLAKDIWAAWSGTKSTKDSRLVAMVNRDTAKLQSLASQRDTLAARIATAKKYAGDLTTSARQGAQLGSLGIADEDVSAGTIQAGLAQKLAKIKTFTSYVTTLAKRGLSKGLLRQILDMGPDQGYAYASALAGSSSAVLKSINSTQASLDSATTSLGRAGADAMYDSGSQAGKGFLAGLTAQQKAIEKKMLDIAKGMQKAIKKALGIKSPSRVMAQLGQYSTQGLAAGLTEGLPHLDQALGVVTDRVASAQPVIGAGVSSAARASAQPVQVQIDVHGAMDPMAVGREIRRVLLELKRTHGVNLTLGVG
jgi:hypothetical protein